MGRTLDKIWSFIFNETKGPKPFSKIKKQKVDPSLFINND